MTISSSVSSSTLNGNGVATDFPFSFVVWGASQLRVYITAPGGSAVESTNWTATLTDAGGTVKYPAVGGAVLPAGSTITILRNMPFTQAVDLVQGVAFDPGVVEVAMDQLTATAQQLREEAARSVKVPPGSTTDPAALIAQLSADAVSAASAAASAATKAGEASASAAAAAASAASVPDLSNMLTKAGNLSGLADAAAARGNLGLGGAATLDPGTTALKLVQLDEFGGLPAVSGAKLTDLPGLDLSIMNTMVFWRSASKSSGAFPGGYLFTFQSQELTGVVNGAWNSVLKGYSNLSGTVQLLSGTPGGAYAAGNTNINRSAAIPNGKTVFRLGYYSSAAATVKLKIVRRNSAGNYTVVCDLSCSHTGGGWQDFALPTPYTVPVDGLEYFLGGFWASAMQHTSGTGLNATIGGDATGTGTYTEAGGQNLVMVRGWYGATANMAMPTTAIAVGTAPNALRVLALVKFVDSVDVAADLKFRCSRNGGSTWTGYIAPTVLCAYDASTYLLQLDADLSALASGTSLVVELSTYNLKEICALALGYVPK